jgi:hypothetical protein
MPTPRPSNPALRTLLRATGLVLLGAALAPAPEALAQVAAQALPSRVNLTVQPNTPVEQEITVANNGAEPVTVTVRYHDWSLTREGAVEILPGGTLAQSLAGCVKVEPSSFTVEPGEIGRFTATLSLPGDDVATRWGLLVSEVRPTAAALPDADAAAVTELGTTLYLSRAPEDAIAPEVAGLEIDPLPGDSIAVTLAVRNAGARHFYLASAVQLKDASGETRNRGRLTNGLVLPGATRNFTWVSPSRLATGDYTARVTLDAGAELPLIAERLFRWVSIPALELPVSQADQ